MATGCNQQLKAGRDFKTKQQLYKPCGLACEPGQTLCPRHIMLAGLAGQKAADKLIANQRAKQAQRPGAGNGR